MLAVPTKTCSPYKSRKQDLGFDEREGHAKADSLTGTKWHILCSGHAGGFYLVENGRDQTGPDRAKACDDGARQ